MALSLASMFTAGGTLALFSLLVPHGSSVRVVGSLACALSGYPGALILWRFGPRLPAWMFPVSLAIGSCLVTLGVYYGNGSLTSVAATSFYVWIALYAFYFFSWLVAALELAGSAIGLVVVLSLGSERAWPSVWVLIMGTAAVAGVIVGVLSRQLSRLATTDLLTGLPNRYYLDQLLTREVATAQRQGRALSLGLIDLDGFKAVNDSYGHLVGDQVLGELAATWSRALRASDILIRFGGDEFVVILPGVDLTEAEQVLRRMGTTADQPWSAGLTAWAPPDSGAALLARADAALYRAKSEGHNHLVVETAAS